MLIIIDSSNNVIGHYVEGSRAVEMLDQDFPTPENQFGKIAILQLDPTTEVFSYNYVDRPLTAEEKFAQDEAQQAAMLLAMVQGGLM